MVRKKKKKSAFKGKVSKDVRRKKMENRSYGYISLPNGFSMFKPEPGGKVKLDIIPYIVSDKNHPDKDAESEIATQGNEWYKRPFKVHRNVGANNETVVCPTSVGKKCPICEYRIKRLKDGDADRDELKELKASDRILYNVIPKGHKKFDEKLHIWDESFYLFQNLLNDEIDEEEDNENFPDLEEGKTLRIRFDSKSIGSSKPFAEASRIDFEDRDGPYDESIYKQVADLDKVLQVKTYDEIQKLYFELDDDDIADEGVEEEEEEEKPKSKKSRRKKPEPEEEEDEDEDDEDEDDDDDDEDEDEDEDGDDDEDEDDDEDDDPPAKTKRTKRITSSKKKRK